MGGTILVLAEQRENGLNRTSWEVFRAGQELSKALSMPLKVAVLGSEVRPVAEELASRSASEIILVEHALLRNYTPDGYVHALRQLLASSEPHWVMMSHTYQARDFAPQLAAASDRALVGDAVAFRLEGDRPVFVRQIFQGKINADVIFDGDPPYFVSFQAGAIRGDEVELAAASVPITRFDVQLFPGDIRTEPLEVFREAKQAVDLTKAEIIVAMGRGIKNKENIDLAVKLAEALGGELAASRPICDNEWLPMDRQIGSSGQTVSPKLYIALGISGAIQHLVGMKGSRTIVAINKDPDAPIFDIADYGIVGDLFEIVPELTNEILKSKAS